MKNLDYEGQIVFQAMTMAGHSPRQALLNSYGICIRTELTDSPFYGPALKHYLPSYVYDAIFSTPETEIEELFWKYHERV